MAGQTENRTATFIRRHPDALATAIILAAAWVLLALWGGRLQIETVHALLANLDGTGTLSAPVTLFDSSGVQTSADGLVPTGATPRYADFRFQKGVERQVRLEVQGRGLRRVSIQLDGEERYRLLREIPARSGRTNTSLTITDLPGRPSAVHVRLELHPHVPVSGFQPPANETVSVGLIPDRKSALPSLTLLTFIVANYLVLRAWLSPTRALAVHAASVALIFAVPGFARTAAPWVVMAELALLAKSAWPLTSAPGKRLLTPVLAGLCLLAVVNAAPWVYNLAGDYWTLYDTQPGIVVQYRDAGLNLFEHGDFVVNRGQPTPMFFPPLYPLLFGGLFTVFGPVRESLAAVNMLALAALVAGAYLLGARLAGRPLAGLLAALFVALWPDITLSAARTQPEFLAAVFAVWAVVATVLVLRRRAWWFVVPGTLAALAAYTRGEYLIYALGLAGAVLVLLRKGGARQAGVIVLTCVLLVAPWTVRNATRFHALIPMNVGNGLSLILGVAQVQSAGELGLVESDAWVSENDGMKDVPFWDPAREAHRVSWALGLIRDNPVWYVTHLPRRWLLWAGAENDIYLRGNPDVFSREHVSYSWSWQRWWYNVTVGQGLRAAVVLAGPGSKALMLLAFGGVVLWMAVKRRLEALVLFTVLPGYLFLIFTPFRFESRYVTAAWVLMATACLGMMTSWSGRAASGETAHA